MTSTVASPKSLDRAIYWFTAVSSGPVLFVLLVAPVLALKLATDLGFTNDQIALLLSVELAAFAFATIPSYWWLRRVDIRKAIYFFAALAIAGNIASSFFTDFGALAVCRSVTGLASGSITVVILAIGAKASNGMRAFALYFLPQVVVGAIVLFFFPAIYSPLPIAALYWTIAALEVPVLAVAHLLPAHLLKGTEESATETKQASDAPRFISGLASIVIFTLFALALWIFSGQVAATAGLSTNAISIAVGVATVVGVIGPFFPFVVPEHRSLVVVVAGFIITAAAPLLMLGVKGVVIFTIAATALQVGQNSVMPYLFAAVGVASRNPHVMGTINLLTGITFVVAPLVGAQVLGSAGERGLLFACAGGILLATMLGLYSAMALHGEKAPVGQVEFV